ncbi:MAG: hypothetical protein EKK29_05900 [Hyphomicrobiales bacterium]|nr:MAG: hypothetical protein EKK29_05900 [Hyphomicrobiales bacterium]
MSVAACPAEADTAARLAMNAEDLFLALDALVDAILTDGVPREAYARELAQAQAALFRAMGAAG